MTLDTQKYETSVHYFTLLVIIVLILIYCSINIDKTTQKYNPIKSPSYTLKGSTYYCCNNYDPIISRTFFCIIKDSAIGTRTSTQLCKSVIQHYTQFKLTQTLSMSSVSRLHTSLRIRVFSTSCTIFVSCFTEPPHSKL